MMKAKSKSVGPNRRQVDPTFCFLFGLDTQTTTLDLRRDNPGLFATYRNWHSQRADVRRIGNSALPLEKRIAAYLTCISRQPQRFQIGVGQLPSSNWLQERLKIHRNTMGKYIKEANETGSVRLGLTLGSQLAFAAAIYPPATRIEKDAVKNPMENRLDLIDDYHLTQNDKTLMVQSLIPITRTGKNNLFRATQIWYNERRGHSERDHLPPVRGDTIASPVQFTKTRVICDTELGGHLRSYRLAS